MELTKQHALNLLKQKDFGGALDHIKEMLFQAEQAHESGNRADLNTCALLDETVQAYTNLAFSGPFRGARSRQRVQHGLGAIQLQLSSASALPAPYNTLPKTTLLRALNALTGIISNDRGRLDFPDREFKAIEESFRILQRLITGVGVRYESAPAVVDERQFNMVLNAVSNAGRMDMAHKVVALQERTAHAPPLSPVAFSILLKGYGRLKDLHNVKMTLSHAQKNQIEPDTVMLNSVIDAFVNCDSMGYAEDVFEYMRDPQFHSRRLSKFGSLFSAVSRPLPNGRTYNTMLKGLARKGAVAEALGIAGEMEEKNLWDDVTTNTVVDAAVVAQEFDLAETLLTKHTAAVVGKHGRSKKHPNVEAYTDLINGYSKASKLNKALATMQLMRQRGVEPNAYTYASMIGALARAKKIDQAVKMLEFMESNGFKPTVVTYNAFISGLVTASPADDDEQDHQLYRETCTMSQNVNHAIKVFRRMLNAKVRPNAVTVSQLVEAFGKCEQPRIAEAKALVSKLEEEQIIEVGNARIYTSLIRTCGGGNDLKGALGFLQQMKTPDTVAVNAFIDSCCRCDQEKMAFDTFEHYFDKVSDLRLAPDVITYSLLISSLLTHSTTVAVERVRRLYYEMKNRRGIMPDNALIDIILTAMIRGGSIGLKKSEIHFTLSVIRDAEQLQWEPGQFEKRKRAVRAVMVGRMSEVWKEDESRYGMTARKDDDIDELFERKGWNRVDSGFSLWGGGFQSAKLDRNDDTETEDEFLASKGWNDVDSGFRII